MMGHKVVQLVHAKHSACQAQGCSGHIFWRSLGPPFSAEKLKVGDCLRLAWFLGQPSLLSFCLYHPVTKNSCICCNALVQKFPANLSNTQFYHRTTPQIAHYTGTTPIGPRHLINGRGSWANPHISWDVIGCKNGPTNLLRSRLTRQTLVDMSEHGWKSNFAGQFVSATSENNIQNCCKPLDNLITQSDEWEPVEDVWWKPRETIVMIFSKQIMFTEEQILKET